MNILKKTLKIVGIIVASIILLMILTVGVAIIFEDKLASFTMEKLEDKIDAPMSVGKVSIIPLFSFPRLSAEINKLYIGDPHSQYNDTLFFINSLKIGLDTWDLIHGVYTIDEMEISGLDFDYEVDSVGKSNIDFIINAFVDPNAEVNSDTISTPLDLSAEKLKLENINVRYYDSLNNIGTQISIPEITLKAKTKNNIYQGKTKGSFTLSHSIFKDSRIDEMESCTVIFELGYKDKEATINNMSIISEGINLGLEGAFGFGDTLKLNTIIDAKNLDFDILKKYMPSQYGNIFGADVLPQMKSFSLALVMDYHNNYASVQKLLLNSDGIGLGLVGNFNLSDTLDINADIESLKLDLGTLKKYIPTKYFKEFGIVDIGGIINASAAINGKFADSTLLPVIVADANLESIKVQSVDYPQIDAFNLKANITNGGNIDMSEAAVIITNAEIISNNSKVQVVGNIFDLENPRYNLSSNLDLNLVDFNGLIPDSLAQNLKGNIHASIKTMGVLPKEINDEFIDYALGNTSLSFNFDGVGGLFVDSLQVEKLTSDISYSSQNSGVKEVKISNLELKSSTLNLNMQKSSLSADLLGDISNLQELSVNLKSLKIQNGKSQIVGNGEVKNLESPEFDINTNIVLELDELLVFLPDSLINNMTGTIVTNIKSSGKLNLDSLDTQIFPILFENSNINLAFTNVNILFPDSIMDVNSVTARLGLRDDILSIDNLSATYNGLELGIDSSRVENIYKTIILNQKEELYVNTHISIGDVIFDDFKYLMALNQVEPAEDASSKIKETHDDSNTTDNSRNWTFLIHGSANINSIIVDSLALNDFDINRLHINDLSALFKFSDSSYIVDQFKLSVFEGEMNNSFNYKIRKDGTKSASTHNIVQNMNIRTMLMDMDNFGMDSVITYENISGVFSTDLHTFIPIDDSVRIDKMLVSGDITLEKGGVYNYAPATEISRFTSVKELDNIQFKTLRSNVFMFKNKLYVPRTNIVSNALDIAAFGMHNLDGNSEYHMELHLSNILFGKSKKRNKKQDKSGEEVDEESLKKSSQKIRYAVTDGKSKVGRDTKDARNDMMNKIRVQKKMLDFIFFPKNIHYNTVPE